MPSWKELIPYPWTGREVFRETGLLCVDNRDDREALRRVGRLMYEMALELTHETDAEWFAPRSELRSAAADLRFLQGYLATVLRESEESVFDAEDQALADFAGTMAGKVAAIADAIEEKLR